MKSLKLSKEDALVCGKYRRLIRGTEEDSDDSWVNVSDCFWYQLTWVFFGLKGHKTVVFVLLIHFYCFFLLFSL